MIYTQPIEFPGIKEVEKNIEYYKQIFMKDGLLVFRNAFLNDEEQNELQLLLGDYFGFYPNNSAPALDAYTENHSRLQHTATVGKEDIIIRWHIEHEYYDNPIVAALWNMKLFNVQHDHGNTIFVDVIKVYEALSSSEKEFLNKLIVKSDAVFSIDLGKKLQSFGDYTMPFVVEHWLTKKPTLRIGFQTPPIPNSIYEIEGRKPTDSEQKQFTKLLANMINNITTKLDTRIVHQWQEGDIVIPDLHRMAHTVLGGFDPKDREFRGLWSYQKDFNKHPRIEIERRKKGERPWE